MTGTFRPQVGAKPADAPIHPILRARWSPRAFLNQAVAPETLRGVLEAARWAASSRNLQPWSFIVTVKDDAAAFNQMLSVLVPQNAQWAKNVPVLILAVAANTMPANGQPNRHALYDVGQAVAQLIVEATARGLVAHQMGGFDAEKAHEVFAIPADHEPVVVIALGYLGEDESLPEPLRKIERAPRARKPLEEIVFAGRWGNPAPLAQSAEAAEDNSEMWRDSTAGAPAAGLNGISPQGEKHDQTN
jgi:nitroreductase